MKTALDCIPCLLRQALEAARLVSTDPLVHEQAVREVLHWSETIDLAQSPPVIAQRIHRRLRQMTGIDDPYQAAKMRQNQAAVALLPALRAEIQSAASSLMAAARVAIAGNQLAAIGMVLHEFPEGIVTFLLLKRAGFTQKKAIGYAFLAAAISTPLGTLVSFPLISKIDQAMLGSLLALSAGTLVYVGASHLLPAVEKENQKIYAPFVGSRYFGCGFYCSIKERKMMVSFMPYASCKSHSLKFSRRKQGIPKNHVNRMIYGKPK